MLKNNRRFKKLDGLRGVTALMVATNHSMYILNIRGVKNIWEHNLFDKLNIEAKITQLIMLFANGSMAVTIFFVLSGLVLGLSLDRLSKKKNYWIKFWEKRIIRIYPLYIALLFFTSIFIKLDLIKNRLGSAIVSEWFLWWPKIDSLPKEVLKNTLFLSTSMSNVTWTLKVEMVILIFVPILHRISRLNNKKIDCLILLGLMSISIYTNKSSSFLYMFYLGLISINWKNILMLNNNWLKLLNLFVLTSLSIRLFIDKVWIIKLVESVTVWLLLVNLVSKEKDVWWFWLNNKWFQYIGKISYGFYLFHFLVLYLIWNQVLNSVSDIFIANNILVLQIVMGIASILLTIPVANLLHNKVESKLNKLRV